MCLKNKIKYKNIKHSQQISTTSDITAENSNGEKK